MKGMIVEVFRRADGYDCTNGGVSSKHAAFVLVGEGVPELAEADERYPVLFLERNGNFGYRAVPGEPGWKMFGGNFIYSSDGRFWELSRGPIPIHDRFEESCR